MDSVADLGERWHWIYRSLTHGTRRQLIGTLVQRESGVRVSLPEAAKIPEYRTDPAVLQRNLIHHHLPILTREEFVEWQREPFRAWRGEHFEDVAAVLQAVSTYDELPEHLQEGCHFLDSEVDMHD
jgi:hypothetical protein